MILTHTNFQALLILLPSLYLSFCASNIITRPVNKLGRQIIVVAVDEGEENVTIFCQIRQSQIVVDYNWTLYNSTSNTTNILEVEFEGNVAGFPFITVTNGTNITIDQFTTYMNRMQLSCGINNVSETFLFGISGK